jgi:hypothetical protein
MPVRQDGHAGQAFCDVSVSAEAGVSPAPKRSEKFIFSTLVRRTIRKRHFCFAQKFKSLTYFFDLEKKFEHPLEPSRSKRHLTHIAISMCFRNPPGLFGRGGANASMPDRRIFTIARRSKGLFRYPMSEEPA